MKIQNDKIYYVIAEYWLSELRGFIKIGDDKNEILEIYNNRYNGDFGVTEQSFKLYEVKFKEVKDNANNT